MDLQPYLYFEGSCDEAIEFYGQTLGAQVTGLLRFKQSPVPSMTSPENADKVMHAALKIGEQTVLISDGHCRGKPRFDGFALTISLPDAAEMDRVFAALGGGGNVTMAATKTFFSERFGMITDRFSLSWIVMVAGQ